MKTHKKSGGFSYVEVLVAVALFVILLASVLPLMTMAGRNMTDALELYEAHLAANSLMLTTRDNIGNTDLPQKIENQAELLNIEDFTVWILGEESLSFGTASDFSPTVTSSFSQTSGHIIVAVVRDEAGNIIGRAVGVRI